MTTINTAGRLLAADIQERVLRYLLLPFGEPGNTSAGRVTASAGTITLPADPTTLVANDEHDYKKPLGKFQLVTETSAGIEAAVKVLPTRAGDDLLAEAAEGVKTGISVEIGSPVIRDGKLLAGALEGAGFVVRPAFPSAQLVAADMGELADQAQAIANAAAGIAADLRDETTENQEQSNTNTEENNVPVTAGAPAAAGATLAAAAANHSTAPAQPAGAALTGLYAALAGIPTAADGGSDQLRAALSPITQTNVFDPMTVPDYVGELWQGRTYAQRFAPLVTQGTLTSAESIGWEITAGPEVGDYAGDLAAVPSNAVTINTKTVKAGRVAGGNAVDRIFTDLPDQGFWASYLRYSNDDYLKKIDGKVLAHIAANKTDAELPALPAFYDGAKGWAMLYHGARVLLDNALPTYAIVGSDLWFEMALTNKDQALEFLNTALGMEDGQVDNFRLIAAPVSDTSLNGKVMVGAQGATTLEQLPGGPVRVNAQGISTGSIDHGVFGYYKLWTPDPKYIVNVVDLL